MIISYQHWTPIGTVIHFKIASISKIQSIKFFKENCFCCTECGIPFNTNSFFEYNSLPYCERHYHYKRGSLCKQCQKPINGRCVTAMSKKFHPVSTKCFLARLSIKVSILKVFFKEHFICSFCTRQLTNGTFKERSDKPYCHTCYIKLFPE